MKTIEEEPNKRLLENKSIAKQTIKDQEYEYDMVNCSFNDCVFSGVIFQGLSKTSFERCEFNKCVFYKDLRNVHFFQCKHTGSNFTKIKLVDSSFVKSGILSSTILFSNFDSCTFEDGEIVDLESKQNTFLNCSFVRFNIISNSRIHNSTFTGSMFKNLMIRNVTHQSTSFKNCSFHTVNASNSVYTTCDFPYSKFFKCSYNANHFVRCIFHHFGAKNTNLLRNSFEGSRMNYVVFERSNFSYNDLRNGFFNNITFTFCITRDNKKKDATFCNSEMLTSTRVAVICDFKREFTNQDSYTYSLQAFARNGVNLAIPEQNVVVVAKASSVTFLVSYDTLNLASILQVHKKPVSSFSSIFSYSTNSDEVVEYLTINEKVYMRGEVTVNGNRIIGFIASTKERDRIRSNSV